MINDVDINHFILPTWIPVLNRAKSDEQGHTIIILASGLILVSVLVNLSNCSESMVNF